MGSKDKAKEKSSKGKEKGKTEGKSKSSSKGKDSKKASSSTSSKPSVAATTSTPAKGKQEAPAAASTSSGSSSSSIPHISEDAGQLSHPNMLKNNHFADVILSLADGQEHVHSIVLEVRCDKLAKAWQAQRKGGRRKKQIVVDLSKDYHMNSPTLQKVLRFLYADDLELDKYQPLEVLQLAVAGRDLGLPRLARLSQLHVKSVLSMENVFGLLKGAADAKEEKILAYCKDFVHRNIQDFIKRKSEVEKLGIELFQELIALSIGEYVEPPPENDPAPPSTLIADFKKLHDSTMKTEVWADAYVQIESKRIPFHKAVLAAHSKAFERLFQPTTGKEEDLTEALAVEKDMSAAAFQSMLKYIYYGETSITPVASCDLAPFAKRCNLLSLQKLCEQNISQNIDSTNILSIMKVAYSQDNIDRPEMKELRASCLEYMLENVSMINLDPLLQMDIKISVDVLRSVQKWHKEGKGKKPAAAAASEEVPAAAAPKGNEEA